MEENVKTINDEITMTDVLLFVKRYFVKILLRGIISVAIVIALVVLGWIFLPSKTNYSVELENTLKRSGDNVYLYPNEKPFNSQDVISPVVLREVYNHLKLEKKISYEDFAPLFYIDNSNMKLALLDAEYAEKLSKKNLNTVSLGLLEKEYNEKKAKIVQNMFSVNMLYDRAFTRGETMQVVSAVPETWFRIYSKTEAAVLPKVELGAWEKEFAESLKAQDGNLLILEKARIYSKLLEECCEALQGMMDGKNITLDSGEYLEDIQRKLDHITKFQIEYLSQYIVMSSKLFAPQDKIFLLRSLKLTDRKLAEVDESIDSSIRAINLLQAGKVPVSQSAGKSGTTVNVDFDSTVFTQITDLVRNDVTNSTRNNIAYKLMIYGKEKAEIVAEKKYIQDLLETQKNKVQMTELYTAAQLKERISLLQKDLLSTARKVQQLHDKVVNEYLSSRLFYKPAGNSVKIHKVRSISIVKFAIGLLVVFVIINIGMICWDFKFKYQQQ